VVVKERVLCRGLSVGRLEQQGRRMVGKAGMPGVRSGVNGRRSPGGRSRCESHLPALFPNPMQPIQPDLRLARSLLLFAKYA